MKKQILITIGREYGSGGHDLAVLLSQRLGIRMLDRELIDELWKNDPEMQRLAQEYDERPVNRILSRKINEFDNSIPHNVAQRQFDMIRQFADSGESAIFVGRCADYALAGRPAADLLPGGPDPSDQAHPAAAQSFPGKGRAAGGQNRPAPPGLLPPPHRQVLGPQLLL